jgi:4-hydroxy-4-methyl-2-oxoglutarate aldolase
VSDFATSEVLQAAGGAARRVEGLAPITITAAVCGPAATCACAPGDNLALHRLLQEAGEGSVLVVQAGTECAYFGELMSMDAEYRGVQGLVIDGSIRDGGAVATLGFPVFHRGLDPSGPKKERVVSVGEPVTIGGVEIAPGDQVVADSDAVVVVAAADWRTVETAAQEICDREDEIRIELTQGTHLSDLLDLP